MHDHPDVEEGGGGRGGVWVWVCGQRADCRLKWCRREEMGGKKGRHCSLWSRLLVNGAVQTYTGLMLPFLWPSPSALTCSDMGQLEFMMVNLLSAEHRGAWDQIKAQGTEESHQDICIATFVHWDQSGPNPRIIDKEIGKRGSKQIFSVIYSPSQHLGLLLFVWVWKTLFMNHTEYDFTGSCEISLCRKNHTF